MPIDSLDLEADDPAAVLEDENFVGSKNIRTRGPNKNGSKVIGNNDSGQKGKMKCLLCRKHRQKVVSSGLELMHQCEYTDIDLQCTRCAARGSPCSKEDKVWPPLRQEKEGRLHPEPIDCEAEEANQAELAQVAHTPVKSPLNPLIVDLDPFLIVSADDQDTPAPFPVRGWNDCVIPGETPTIEPCTSCGRAYCGFQRWREFWKVRIPGMDEWLGDFSMPFRTLPLHLALNSSIGPGLNVKAPPSASFPRTPVTGMYSLLKSSLASVVENTQTYIQQAWSSINDAQTSLLKIVPVIETTEQLISSVLPFTGELKIAYYYHLSEYIETLYRLDIKGAWTGVGKAWTHFTERMQALSSAAAALGSKCGPHLTPTQAPFI